jgi:hypothetical protein
VTAVVVALSVAVVLLGLLVAGLLRSHAEILRALHELGAGLELDRKGEPAGPQPLALEPFRAAADPGERPTHVSGTTLEDEAVSLPLQGAGDTLVAFLSSGCSTCQEFWDAFASPHAVPGGARLVVVAQDLAEESASALRERTSDGLTLLLSSETWAEFGVPGSPYFVYVDGSTGRPVGEGSAATWQQVSDLMSQALADAPPRDDPGGRRHRLRRDDAALLAAGIVAGDPSLHVHEDHVHEDHAHG